MDPELKSLIELIADCVGEGDRAANHSLSVIVRNSNMRDINENLNNISQGQDASNVIQRNILRENEETKDNSIKFLNGFLNSNNKILYVFDTLSDKFKDLISGIPVIGGILGGIYGGIMEFVKFQRKNIEEYRKMFYTNVPWFTQDLDSLHKYAADIGINHEQLMNIYQANSLYISKLEAFTGNGIEAFNTKLKSIIHAGDVYGVDEQNATLLLNDIISSTYDNLSNNINNINERSEIYLKNLKALSYWSGKSVDTLIKENKIKEDDLAGKLWEAQGGAKQKILMNVLSGMNASSAMKADFAMAMDRGSIANTAPVNSELYRILRSLMNLRQHENMYSDSEYQYEVDRIMSSIDKTALARVIEMNPAVGGHLSQDMQYAGVMAMNLSQHAGNWNDIKNNIEKRDENGNIYKINDSYRALIRSNENILTGLTVNIDKMKGIISGINNVANCINTIANDFKEIMDSDNPVGAMFGKAGEYFKKLGNVLVDSLFNFFDFKSHMEGDEKEHAEETIGDAFYDLRNDVKNIIPKEELTELQRYIRNGFETSGFWDWEGFWTGHWNKELYSDDMAVNAFGKFFDEKLVKLINESSKEERKNIKNDMVRLIKEGANFITVDDHGKLIASESNLANIMSNSSKVIDENTKSVKEQIEQQKKNSELDSSRTNLANAMTNSSNAMKENTEAVKAQTEQQKQNQENKKELSEKMGLSFNDMLEGKHLNKFSEDYKKTIENSTDNTNLTALKKSYEISELKNHLFSEHLTEIGKLLEKSKAEKLNEKEFNLLFDMDSKNFGQMMDEEAREEYLENRKNAFNEYIKDPDYVMKQLFSEYMSLASSNSENNISKTSPMNSNNEQMPEMKNQYEEKQKLEQAEKAEQARKEQEENQKQENAEIKQKIQSQYQQSGNLLDVLKSINDKLDKLNALANIDRATKNIYENGVGSKFKTEE